MAPKGEPTNNEQNPTNKHETQLDPTVQQSGHPCLRCSLIMLFPLFLFIIIISCLVLFILTGLQKTVSFLPAHTKSRDESARALGTPEKIAALAARWIRGSEQEIWREPAMRSLRFLGVLGWCSGKFP